MLIGLLGILAGLARLVALSYRGGSVLVLANWTITFMSAAGGFVIQFFPLFLLGAVFGKLMEDSGSVAAIARWMTLALGARRAILAVVLAGAAVTYGGVSLFVALFVLAPMAQALFREADIPNRLMPATIALGTMTFTMSALPGTPAVLVIANRVRLPKLRETVDAGASASVLPVVSVASLVGFGAVVAAMPAFTAVRDAVLSIGGGPLVSLAVATNVLSALTGSASGGLTIALEALGGPFMAMADAYAIDPSLLHRVAVISAGTLDSLPHNGAVVTLIAVCGSTHKTSYFDIVMVAVVGAIVALVAMIVLGTLVGSF